MTGPVLVVDSDAASREALVRALQAADLSCVAVGSGVDALARVESLEPSLVLLDLHIPPPDGYEVLRRFRSGERTKDLPVVVLAALDPEDAIARAFASGADDFVKKPWRPVELVARIRGQLRLRGMMMALERKEKDAQLVLELTQALASNLDFRGILFTVVQRIAEVVKVDRVSIVLVREEGDVGYVVAASDDHTLRDLPIDLAKYPEITQVLESREPLIVSTDSTRHPLIGLARKDGGQKSFSAVVIVPIIYEGRPMGVLFLRAKQAFSFGDHELALCSTVASATAIALRNARVLQSLRDQTQQVTVARFEAERKLRALQRYADFFESSADGILVIDNDGRVLFSNPRASEITGFSELEFRSRRVGAFFDEKGGPDPRELQSGFARGVFPKNLDIGIRKAGGDPAILSVNFNSVLREDSVVLCSFRDVTLERATAAELVKTKDFLQRVIDSSVDAIISADMGGRVLLFNRAAERVFGMAAASALGGDVRKIYPGAGAREVMKRMWLGGGRIEGFRTEIVDASGKLVPVSLSAALLFDGDVAVGSVGIFTDLRERMRMEERLQQAQEQLLAQERQSIVAELAGTAAHELNQPLTSVMGYAELLKRRLEPGTAALGAAEIIFGEAERMAEIVRKIGKITKYETKSYVGRARILDLDRSSDQDRSGQPPLPANEEHE